MGQDCQIVSIFNWCDKVKNCYFQDTSKTEQAFHFINDYLCQAQVLGMLIGKVDTEASNQHGTVTKTSPEAKLESRETAFSRLLQN